MTTRFNVPTNLPKMICLVGVGLLGACTIQSSPDDERVAEGQDALCASSVVINPSRSLFVTDSVALGRFSFNRVMSQIVARGNVGKQSPLSVYQQWWDTQNDASHAKTTGPHCDDSATTVNGFPIDCPRQEGMLAATDPFVSGSPDSYVPVALVNRIDLSPSSAKAQASCGQYRIVFGKVSGLTNGGDRDLIIFEAVLRNPHPELGISGCMPVAQMWGDLSGNNDPVSRADALENFYFNGLPGFSPVVDPANYGMVGQSGYGGPATTGQIRTNQFMPNRPYFNLPPLGQQWQLREFKVTRECTGGVDPGPVNDKVISPPSPASCKLVIRQDSVKQNPFGGLFTTSPGPLGAQFQQDFLAQVPDLVPDDVNGISSAYPEVYSAGQSSEQDSSNDYRNRLASNPAFQGLITGKLAAIGRSDLTWQNVADRATTQSCAGCHQLTSNLDVGGGVIWPSSNGFTQISENGTLSPALTTRFLPHRKLVLETLLNGSACSPSPVTSVGETLGGGNGVN